MPNRVKVIGFKPIARKYRYAEKNLVNSKLLDKIGTAATAFIQTRTERGISLKGRVFKKYTKGYAKYRQKWGRSLRVNLTFKGHMLAAIHHKIIGPMRILMSFIRTEEGLKATYMAGHGREFFGLNRREEKKITIKLINPHLKKLFGGK